MLLEAQKILKQCDEGYVGRTGDVLGRHLDHAGEGRPLLTILHWEKGIVEADYCERLLADAFKDKLVNARPWYGGKKTGHFHAVYIAWSPNSRPYLDKFFEDVEQVWPVRFPHFEPQHFCCSLTREEAKARREEYVRAGQEYWDRTRGTASRSQTACRSRLPRSADNRWRVAAP